MFPVQVKVSGGLSPYPLVARSLAVFRTQRTAAGETDVPRPRPLMDRSPRNR